MNCRAENNVLHSSGSVGRKIGQRARSQLQKYCPKVRKSLFSHGHTCLGSCIEGTSKRNHIRIISAVPLSQFQQLRAMYGGARSFGNRALRSRQRGDSVCQGCYPVGFGPIKRRHDLAGSRYG